MEGVTTYRAHDLMPEMMTSVSVSLHNQFWGLHIQADRSIAQNSVGDCKIDCVKG